MTDKLKGSLPPVISVEAQEGLDMERVEAYVRGNREGEFLGWIRTSVRQQYALMLLTRLLFRLMVRVYKLEGGNRFHHG